MGLQIQEAGGVAWPSRELVDVPCGGVGTGPQGTCASSTVRSVSSSYSPRGSLSELIARPSPHQSAPPPPVKCGQCPGHLCFLKLPGDSAICEPG